METKNGIANIENGNLYLLSTSEKNILKQWNPHPNFNGVSLKHIITGKQTQGKFSSHIVKIEPNCKLDIHIHEGKTELHEVVEGYGTCEIDGIEYGYQPGDCAVIPDNIVHLVVAGEKGLTLFAKFVPALL